MNANNSSKRTNNTTDILSQLAESGDVSGLAELLSQPTTATSAARQAELIKRAIAVATVKGSLGDQLLSNAIATSGEIYLRLSVLARRSMSFFDRRAGAASMPDVPREILLELERLAKIEDRIIVLSRARASLKHVDVLVERGPANQRRSERVLRMDDARAEELKQAGGA